MTICIDAISLFLRRDRIEAVLPAGWDQFRAEWGTPDEGDVDADLVRFGAMDPFAIELLISELRAAGFRLTARRGGKEVFADMCLLRSVDPAPVLPCDWLELTADGMARFTGPRQTPRRPRLAGTGAEVNRASLANWLGQSPDTRAPLPMRGPDGAPGTLTSRPRTRRGLVVDSEAGPRHFRWIEDLLNAGWSLAR